MKENSKKKKCKINYLKLILNFLLVFFSYSFGSFINGGNVALSIVFGIFYVLLIAFDIYLLKADNFRKLKIRNRQELSFLKDLFLYIFVPFVVCGLLILVISLINKYSIFVTVGPASVILTIINFVLMLLETCFVDIKALKYKGRKKDAKN